ALLLREDFILIMEIILPRLEEDAVEGEPADFVGGDLVEVVRPGVARRPPGVALAAVGERGDEELLPGVGQVVEVAPVDVPGEDSQAAHGCPPDSTHPSPAPWEPGFPVARRPG